MYLHANNDKGFSHYYTGMIAHLVLVLIQNLTFFCYIFKLNYNILNLKLIKKSKTLSTLLFASPFLLNSTCSTRKTASSNIFLLFTYTYCSTYGTQKRTTPTVQPLFKTTPPKISLFQRLHRRYRLDQWLPSF